METIMKTESFRSVWDALEDDPVVARAMERRSSLLMLIQDKIEKGKWSQPEVAKMLGISQPRVSDLVAGKAQQVLA
jgi:predicted XRE-type DNA-binding protein